MSKNLDKKASKLIDAAYTEMYNIATTELWQYLHKKLTWEELKSNAVLIPKINQNRKIVPFELFYIPKKDFENLANSYIKQFRKPEYQHIVSFNIYLGPSPNSSEEAYKRYCSELKMFYTTTYDNCDKTQLFNLEYIEKFTSRPVAQAILFIETYKMNHKDEFTTKI